MDPHIRTRIIFPTREYDHMNVGQTPDLILRVDHNKRHILDGGTSKEVKSSFSISAPYIAYRANFILHSAT